MSHIDFTTDIPKHYVRRYGWYDACRNQNRIVRRRSRQIPMRYFTFCAAEAIDVFMLERDGMFQRSEDTGRLDGVYFCENDEHEFGIIANLIGSPEQGFLGDFEKIVLFEEDEDTEGRSIVDEGFYPQEIRKKLHYKDAHHRLRGSFPFDIINLDVFGMMFPPRRGVISPLLRSIIKILEWQTNATYPINHQPCNHFTLFLTSHLDPDNTDKEAIQQLCNRLAENINTFVDFELRFENRFGHRDARRLSLENFAEFFCIAFPKYLIRRALFDLGWEVDYRPIFLYNREYKRENKEYQIMHSVSAFNRIANFEERLDDPVVGLYAETSNAIIEQDFQFVDEILENPEIYKRLEEDLKAIVQFRDRVLEN